MRQIFGLLSLLFYLSTAFAEQPTDIPVEDAEAPPLWELGVGVAGAMIPDYPGASQSHIQALPFPFAIFRGEVLRSDRNDGTRARMLHTDIYEVNLSGSGGLPTNSEANQARKDMPDLDWTFELGPRLLIRLHKFDNGGRVKFGLAARAAYSTDGVRTRDKGFILEPQFQLSYPGFPSRKSFSFATFNLGFTDRRYNQFYYDVEPDDVRSDRREYRSSAGFFGADSTVGTAFSLTDPVHLALFVNLSTYSGSANASSPLMRAEAGWSYGLALVWTLKKSPEKASSPAL